MTEFDKKLWRVATAFHTALVSQSPRAQPLTLPQQSWERCTELFGQISRAEMRGWHLAAAELRKDLAYCVSSLQVEVNAVATLLPRVPTARQISKVSDVYRDLLSLDEEFEPLDFDMSGHWISATTEPITLDDIYLGPFEIRLDWYRLTSDTGYRVIARDPHPAEARSNVTHPHVMDEHMCEGDSRVAIRQALSQGRLLDFFTLVASGLRSYNSESPFVSLDDWSGQACSDCGCSVDEDDSWSCFRCGDTVCDGCRSTCSVCDECCCSQCSAPCEICDDACCRRCLVACQECGQKVCSSCLQEDERCNKCHEKDDEESASAADCAAVQPDCLGQAALSA